MYAQAQNKIRVFGMQRSGNHAIIHWISRNAGLEGTAFFNHLAPGNVLKVVSDVSIGEKRYLLGNKTAGQIRQVLREAGRAKTLIVSYENKHLARALTRPSFTRFGLWRFTWTNVAINRSFMNWLASFIALRSSDAARDKGRYLSPLQVAEAVSDYMNHLEASLDPKVVTIDYDTWVADEGYRQERLQALHLPVADNSLGARQSYGGGSSFEGRNAPIDPAAQRNRWRKMLDNTTFRNVSSFAATDDNLIKSLETVYPEDASLLRQIRKGSALHELS
jgi:hypothetical protein